MLPRPHRLREASGFSRAVRGGRRAGGRLLVLHLGETGLDDPAPDDLGGDQSAQVGFVVSRAVGSAVVRNRVKRRLRHLMRERTARLSPGSVLVVRATPSAAGATSAELGTALDRGLSKLMGTVSL